VTELSLVLIDGVGTAFFAGAERHALRGLGQTADVVYVRRPGAGAAVGDGAGEIVLGPEATRLEMIRAGVERALCPRVAVVDVSLAYFGGAAGLALELLDDDVDFVAAQVVDGEGAVLFREAALALDGTPRFTTSRQPTPDAGDRRPTLLCDPRAFAADRDLLLALLRRAPAISGDVVCAELAWHWWLAGGRALTSSTVTVMAHDGFLPREAAPWKPSLGRLLGAETLARTPEGAEGGSTPSPVRTATRLLRANGSSAEQVESSLQFRERVQGAREVADRALFLDHLLAETWRPAAIDSSSDRRRIAILCSDAIGSSMAGPAIRSIELARVLGEHADVRIAARLGTGEALELPCPLHELSDITITELAGWADAFVVQGPLTDWHRDVLRSELPIAIDLYDPMNLEALESVDPDLLVPYTTNLLHDQLWRGDFFFCASERQRDFWLGMLAASGRVTPGRYAEDPDLNGLIGVVPYGIPEEQPVRTGPGIRAELGIAADDPLFVWNGGIWQWFDPELLVLAVERLRAEIPNVRALFMGVRRPGSELTEEARRLQVLIDEHGLRDRHVFVRDWTPYAERADTYLDATGVVSLHHAHIETRFSFRTRLLDCIWSATPIVCTSGDVLAPIVRDEQLGITVPAGDLDAIVDALRILATDQARVAEMRARLQTVSSRFRWDVAAAPLIAWCETTPARQGERFRVTGLDPMLTTGALLVPAAGPSGLKQLIPRPVRQHVLGPLKRRLLQAR
jgi:glycosyltransferase involved in cell wall biosynthesis